MFGIHDLWLFVMTGFLFNITPGPDMVFFGSRTASQGARSGLAALAGICTGCLVHTAAAAFGLSAILLASANAFLIVKFIGAAYLIYVGISMLKGSFKVKGKSDIALDHNLLSTSHSKIFWQGFLTNVLNPKVAIFFLAFLPQFISADSPTKSVAFLILGLLFIVNSCFVTLPLIWFIAAAREHIRANAKADLSVKIGTSAKIGNGAKIGTWLNRACGALFVSVGIKLAFTERPA
jgi:threonine/homoserine/homoserine lactone efflux protein